MRADVFLAQNGYCESRSKAANAIAAGLLTVNGKTVTKPSFDVAETDDVKLTGEAIPFVGRGGLKLLGAITAFKLSVKGLICADIGASTGGFTDCLLQNGAKRVYAIENGKGQLHPSLLNDERVVSMEGFNARSLMLKDIGEPCDVVVMDVSFISQTLLHEGVCNVLKDGGAFVSLIKPQFEVGRANIGKGGIVKDKKAAFAAIKDVVKSASAHSLTLTDLTVSPITGGDGNTEYLALFQKNGQNGLILNDLLLKS